MNSFCGKWRPSFKQTDAQLDCVITPANILRGDIRPGKLTLVPEFRREMRIQQREVRVTRYVFATMPSAPDGSG